MLNILKLKKEPEKLENNEPSYVEPSKTEPPKDEPPKDEPPKNEPQKNEPPKNEPKAEPPKATNDKDLEKVTAETGPSIKDKLLSRLKLKNAINPQSEPYLLWLALVSFCFVYNIFSLSIRYTFLNVSDISDSESAYNNQTLMRFNESNLNSTRIVQDGVYGIILKYFIRHEYYWYLLDYCSDVIYLVDIFLVQTRKKFLSEGLWIEDFEQTRMAYFKTWRFILDILAIFPMELLQLIPIIGAHSFLRLNRMLKFNILMEFFDRWDMSVQTYTFLVRLIRLLIYLQIVVHIYACVYYKISTWETDEMEIVNEWVYSISHSHKQKYLCFQQSIRHKKSCVMYTVHLHNKQIHITFLCSYFVY